MILIYKLNRNNGMDRSSSLHVLRQSEIMKHASPAFIVHRNLDKHRMENKLLRVELLLILPF